MALGPCHRGDTNLKTAGRRALRRVAAKGTERTRTARATRRRHATTPVGRRRSRTVRGADARVVLRTTPRKTDTRVANGVALHLVDGHLGSMTMDELNKTAAFAGGDLDIRNVAKALEE